MIREDLNAVTEKRPLTNAEALRRATENGTTIADEQASECAEIRVPTFFQKADAKLSAAEEKLEKERAELEQRREMQRQLVLRFDDLTSDADALAARIRDVRFKTQTMRDGLAELEERFRRECGTTGGTQWLYFPSEIFLARNALPILEKALAELRAEHTAKVAEVRAFAVKHHIPRDQMPNLADPDQDE